MAKNGKNQAVAKPQARGQASNGMRKPGGAADRVYRAPAAVSREMKSGASNGVKFTRREYLTDVSVDGTGVFANQNFKVNPGLVSTFPWLSTLANSFEEYEFTRMEFKYEPSTGSTTTGSVMLSFDYDVLDSAPADKIDALTAEDYVRTSPWAPAHLALARRDLASVFARPLFVRNAVIPGTDLKTYDIGQLNMSVSGTGAIAGVIGELWIDYDVILHKPQRTSTAASVSSGNAMWNLDTSVDLIDNAVIPITEEVVNATPPIANAGGVITLPKGNWLVQASFEASGLDGPHTALLIDGVQPTIPALANAVKCSSIAQFVTSTGSTTVSMICTSPAGGTTVTYLSDRCRLYVTPC